MTNGKARRLMMAAALAAALPAAAGAADGISTAAERLGLGLTVYGNGLSLVKDRRPVELPIGINALDVIGISPQLISDSVQLALGPGARVLSRTLRRANLNPRSLLEAHLGKTATLLRRHPGTGAETAVEATIVSVQGGVIARIAGRLVAIPDGRWTFAEVPDHLRGEPVLAVSVESAEAAPREAELRYLAGGLN